MKAIRGLAKGNDGEYERFYYICCIGFSRGNSGIGYKSSCKPVLGSAFSIKRIPYIEDEQNVDEVISLAKLDGAIIAYTLVKPAIRAYMKAQVEKENLSAYDILGPLMDILQERAPKRAA